MTNLEELKAKYPVNEALVEHYRDQMLAEVRGHKLRELREAAGLTQSQLADRIGVGQRQVSKIESGNIDNTRIGTIRRYLTAIGGDLSVEYVMGDERVQVA